MAGVAGPLLRRSKAKGARFLAGLAVGGAAGGITLSVPVYLLGLLAGPLPSGVRVGLLTAMVTGFGIADLLGRTPHVWRQVPQSLVRTLTPGTLGLVWGFDLGLLFTTQKTTSLIWSAIAAVVLLRPASAPILMIVVAAGAALAVIVTSVGGFEPTAERSRRWLKVARRGSGVMMLAGLAAGLVA